jgi:alkylation response protein AidB-like acyl-CoA dehydrogenase
MPDEQPGRDRLIAWRDAEPGNYYEASPDLARVLKLRAGSERFEGMRSRLEAFGAVMAEVVEPAVAQVESHREFPALLAYDAIGRSVASIDFHPAHHRSGEAVWGSGMLSLATKPDSAFELAGLFYLLSLSGEGGHACPAVCTIGLARALQHRGTQSQKDQYLPGLASTDYWQALKGSQFLTEVQGGSDVGANAVSAVAMGDGTWRLRGEKWFCSVANADLFAVTARPAGAPSGTKGLGCFLVPRSLDGKRPNGFRIRRLKDKLGTRALASAEIEFEDAVAWPIGPVEEGFHVAVEELLDTSRWLNALGSSGIMRRAYMVASSYSLFREAFGSPIARFPLVKEQLAMMRVQQRAALASTMALTGLVDLIDRGLASEEDSLVHRFLVNANKYVTSITATWVVHQGIEILGGNGTIEDFSPLPRLYRDAIVFESWEGTHNVLCAQVARDAQRMDLLNPVVRWAEREIAASQGSSSLGQVVLEAVGEAGEALSKWAAEGLEGAGGFRRSLERMVLGIQGACLLHEMDGDADALVELFIKRYLVPGYDPDRDSSWLDLVDAVLEA